MNEFTTLMNTLDTALSLKRQHGSETEALFVAWLIKQVSPTMIDGGGNIHVCLGSSRTIFTSHTDSVHRSEGANTIRKTDTHWYGTDAALGADDGCGIALMLHMIANSIPGRYIFFRGEECGGIGSSWLAAEMPDMLSRYDRAIAFDRAGLGDVITFQAGGRCCSDVFAEALADEMNQDGLMYMPDQTGVFTDTANFIKLIPECTNLSVGYAHQHGPKEELNLRHFLSVAAVVTKIDWEALPTSRDPKVKEVKAPYSISGWSYKGHHSSAFDDWLEGVSPNAATAADDLVLEDDEDAAAEQAVLDAICMAYDGHFGDLIDLMAMYAYPEDPDLAKRHIHVRDLTETRLDEASLDLDSYGPEQAMLYFYDSLPIMA